MLIEELGDIEKYSSPFSHFKVKCVIFGEFERKRRPQVVAFQIAVSFTLLPLLSHAQKPGSLIHLAFVGLFEDAIVDPKLQTKLQLQLYTCIIEFM